MNAGLKVYVISCLSFLLIGCVSPMYFYETEKISLTVEARPDSSQPVQGSLGIKQRLALIAPKKNQNDSNKGDGGEAVSAISSFSFKIMPKENNLFDPLLIQTAFITGEAAKNLEPLEAIEVAKAITLKGVDIKSMDTHAECVLNSARNAEPSKFDILKAIVKKESSKDFTDGDWKNLIDIAKPCGIPDRVLYADSVHKALQKRIN